MLNPERLLRIALNPVKLDFCYYLYILLVILSIDLNVIIRYSDYMKKIRAVSIIRERGQVTIPDAIRKVAKWARPLSAVSVSLEGDEIRIRPHVSEKEKEIDWDKVWSAIKLARSFQGKRGNVSAFVEKDRQHGHD